MITCLSFFSHKIQFERFNCFNSTTGRSCNRAFIMHVCTYNYVCVRVDRPAWTGPCGPALSLAYVELAIVCPRMA